MANLYALTDREVALLQRILDIHRSELGNVPSRPPTERSFDEGEDHQAPEVYVAKPRDEEGLNGLTTPPGTAEDDYDIAGKGQCDIYRISTRDPGVPELVPIEGLQKTVYNIGQQAMPQDWMIALRSKGGPWLGIPTGLSFVGFCSAEDHPGKSIPFDINVGRWDPNRLNWVYDQGLAKAIDHRFGVPYPEKCSTGLGMWMSAVDYIPGTESGTGTSEAADEKILEVWAFDCESPGCPCDGGFGTGTGSYYE